MRHHTTKSGRPTSTNARNRRRVTPLLEQCESRTLLTVYVATTTSELIADVALSNAATTPTEIDLVAGTTYQADVTSDSLKINNTQPLTINGFNATIIFVSQSTNNYYFYTSPLIEVDGGTVVFNNLNLTSTPNIHAAPSDGFSSGLQIIKGTATGNYLDISGFKSNGFGGGAYVGDSGILNLNQSRVEGNVANNAFFGPGFNSAGGGIFNAGVLNIVGGSVSSNNVVGGTSTDNASGAGEGGGIYNTGTLNISGTNLESNRAVGGAGSFAFGNPIANGDGHGGGLYIAGGIVNISSGTLIQGNSAVGGAGATDSGNLLASSDGYPKGSDGRAGNDGTRGGSASGGAIFVCDLSSAIVTITDSTIASNNAYGADGGNGQNGGAGGNGLYGPKGQYGDGGDGGAGGSGGAGGEGSGGALTVQGGTVTLLRTTVANNLAQGGTGGSGANGGAGGLAPLAGRFGGTNGLGGNGGNAAQGGFAIGGGIYQQGGSINSINSTIASNHANGREPGSAGNGGPGYEYVLQFGRYVLQATPARSGTIGSNSVGGQASGGAAYVDSGALLLRNSTVASNFLTNGASSGTIPDGGGIVNFGVVSFANSIIAENGQFSGSGQPASGNDLEGSFDSVGNNLIGDSVGATGLNSTDQAGTTASPLDPKLGTLADNGGPTQTIALLSGSPAINSGNNALAKELNGNPLTTDQRGPGYARIFLGIVDIGAFEYTEPVSLSIHSGTGQTANGGSKFATDLVTYSGAYGLPVSGVVVTFTAPSSGAGGTFSNGSNTIQVTTDAHGLADPGVFTANSTGGSYSVQASASGATPVLFALTNFVKAATSFSQVGGSAVYNGPIVVSATLGTAAGPLANQTVSFLFQGTNYSATTNAQGVASASVGTAKSFGGYPFSVTYGGTSNFIASSASGLVPVATYGLPATLQIFSLGSNTVDAGSVADPAIVKVVDAYGNTVPNVVVGFSAPAAAGSFAGSGQATTDANGLATAPTFTASLTPGAYTLTASVFGSPSIAAVTYPLTVSRISTTTSNASLTGIQHSTGTLAAKVTNAKSATQPVAGVVVIFYLNGSSVETGRATTDATGVASLAYSIGDLGSVSSLFVITPAGVGNLQSFASGTVSILAQGNPALVSATQGAGQATGVGASLGSAFQVRVTDLYGNPIPSSSVTFAAPTAAGTFAGGATSAVVVTDSSGLATSPAFRAGLVAGSFTATATVTNVATPAQFGFTVAPTTIAPTVGIGWGSSGSASLVTVADGLRLLPAGRANDLPWLNIRQFTFTLGTAVPITPANVSVTGINLASYGPVTVSGSGTTWTITLAQPIAAADRVTLTVSNPGIATFVRRLDVLPGDVNDDGAVNAQDLTLEAAAMRNQVGVPLVFADIDGDGSNSIADYNLIRARLNSKLPPIV
jgi:hypothetical protein